MQLRQASRNAVVAWFAALVTGSQARTRIFAEAEPCEQGKEYQQLILWEFTGTPNDQ